MRLFCKEINEVTANSFFDPLCCISTNVNPVSPTQQQQLPLSFKNTINGIIATIYYIVQVGGNTTNIPPSYNYSQPNIIHF